VGPLTAGRLVTEPVTFEVDSFDPFLRTGWSVVVEGLAYEPSDREMEYEDINLWPLLERQNSRLGPPGSSFDHRSRITVGAPTT
jgi:hypothetical protein